MQNCQDLTYPAVGWRMDAGFCKINLSPTSLAEADAKFGNILHSQTTDLIHGLEERRDNFMKLQLEGGTGDTFMSYNDLEELEQIRKWTTARVRVY